MFRKLYQMLLNLAPPTVHMRPNVSGFGVQRKYALKARCEAGQGRPMTRPQKFVVLQPLRQELKVLAFPFGLPKLKV